MTRDPIPRIALFAIYFGSLPSYFQLWLDSCARNPELDWILVTDAPTTGYRFPRNVTKLEMTLDALRLHFSETLEYPVNFAAPYKLCDFRPCYWVLLRLLDAPYDLWGHCDIDLIFGRIADFVIPLVSRLPEVHKFFTVGHLTIYRNTDLANNMFRRHHPVNDWTAVFSSSNNFGFDEHFGVNVIWSAYPQQVYSDESIIADIDPAKGRLERTYPFSNFATQLFYVEDGRVFRGSFRNGTWFQEEFAYIHLQKRSLPQPILLSSIDNYFITASGFARKEDRGEVDIRTIRRLNGYTVTFRGELQHRIRLFVRGLLSSAKRSLLGTLLR